MAYKCPNGCNGTFTIYGAVELHHEIRVDNEGNCLDSTGGDITWEDEDKIECNECGAIGTTLEWDE